MLKAGTPHRSFQTLVCPFQSFPLAKFGQDLSAMFYFKFAWNNMESRAALTLLSCDRSQSLLQVEFVMWKRFETRTVGGIFVATNDEGPSLSCSILVTQWCPHLRQEGTGDSSVIPTWMAEKYWKFCP